MNSQSLQPPTSTATTAPRLLRTYWATVRTQRKSFNKSDLLPETIEWLDWYNGLTETERLSISYIPADLYKLCGYAKAEDVKVVEPDIKDK